MAPDQLVQLTASFPAAFAAYILAFSSMRKALTIKDVMKMPRAERLRRGKLSSKRERIPRAGDVEPETPHPILKKWRKAEKPIEIIE